VQEVYNLIEDEFSSANDLAAMISRDPALTNRVLRLANAAHYRHMGGQVHTVSRAVVLLGFVGSARHFLTHPKETGKIKRLAPVARASSLTDMQQGIAELARDSGIDPKQLEEASRSARKRILEYRVLLAKEHDQPAFLARMTPSRPSLSAPNCC